MRMNAQLFLLYVLKLFTDALGYVRFGAICVKEFLVDLIDSIKH